MTLVTLIAAVSENNVIGKNGKLPWYIPEDMRHFKNTTMGYPVVMGRKTFESLGQPLGGRINIVLSRNPSLSYDDGVQVYHNLENVIDRFSHWSEIFICGGQQVYETAMPLANTLNITRVHADFDGDTFFPYIDEDVWKWTSIASQTSKVEPFWDFSIVKYVRTKEAP